MTANPFVILYIEDNDYIRLSFAELLATAERRVLCVLLTAPARATALREQNVNLLDYRHQPARRLGARRGTRGP